jgi:hypothetical protein
MGKKGPALKIVKQDKCPKYSWNSKFPSPEYYCIQHITVTLAFNIHMFGFTLSTFCGHIMLRSVLAAFYFSFP